MHLDRAVFQVDGQGARGQRDGIGVDHPGELAALTGRQPSDRRCDRQARREDSARNVDIGLDDLPGKPEHIARKALDAQHEGYGIAVTTVGPGLDPDDEENGYEPETEQQRLDDPRQQHPQTGKNQCKLHGLCTVCPAWLDWNARDARRKLRIAPDTRRTGADEENNSTQAAWSCTSLRSPGRFCASHRRGGCRHSPLSRRKKGFRVGQCEASPFGPRAASARRRVATDPDTMVREGPWPSHPPHYPSRRQSDTFGSCERSPRTRLNC